MSFRKALPTLEQIITNHLNDVDYMALNLQSMVVEDVVKNTLPIHHKNFNLASKLSTTKHQFIKTPSVFKSLKKSQSTGKPITSINFNMSSVTKTPRKNQQFDTITDTNDNTLCESTLSARNKLSTNSKTFNRKTLSRFLFQFQIPVSRTSPRKGIKTLSIPIDKIHTFESNIQLKRKNRSEIVLRKTYITEPLNIESKPIAIESKKMKTISVDEDCDRRPRSCYLKLSARRQKTQFCQYPWELKPWAIRGDSHQF